MKMKKTFELPQPDEKTISYSVEQPIEEWLVKYFNTIAG